MGQLREKAKSAIPRAIVVATGLVLGGFVWKTYFAPVSPSYPVEFQHASWIAGPNEEPQAYFRKELHIAGPVQQAWITVAATDAFILYLNGQVLESKGYYAMNLSGIYDIGRILHPGMNVVGVVVRRGSYPGPAMAALEGGYRDDLGGEHFFASDASWRVSVTEQKQAGKIAWYEDLFDASRWMNAMAVDRPDASEIYPLAVHPWAFQMPEGMWIGFPDGHSDLAPAACTLNLASGIEDAWIRIVAAEPYTFVVNGVNVAGRTTKTFPAMRDPVVPPPIEVTGSSTDLYNVTSLLKRGENQIVIMTESERSSQSDFYIDGFVVRSGKALSFGTKAQETAVVSSRSARDRSFVCSSATAPLDTEVAGQALPGKRVLVTPLAFNTVETIATLVSVVLLFVWAVLALWKNTARVVALLQPSYREESENVSALLFFPILLFLGGLFFISFDVRFAPPFPFQGDVLLFAGITLLALNGFLMGEARKKQGGLFSPARSWKDFETPYVRHVLLVSLIMIGAFLRLNHLNGQSLYHDEVHMTYFVKGIFEKGYPFKVVGPFERPLATYELVPWPIALSTFLFGDWAVRLPAALFGIVMIFFIYYVGKNIFDQRVGLLAAAIYTFCPQALVWARYLWHPQQVHFMALVTAYLFYRTISSETISPKNLYLVAGSFILTYLSWEGVGFLLPGLFLGLLVTKGRDFSWMREKHLWGAVGLVAVAVMLQMLRRIGLQFPYMTIGSGLSEVSLPVPFFLDPMYDPTFYIRNFLWLENNAILTLLAVSGLFFCRKHKGFAYLATLLFGILFMMTNFLAHAAMRYAYYLQPFLILTASFVVFRIVDGTMGLAKTAPFEAPRLAGGFVTVMLCMGVVLGSSVFMKLYRLTGFETSSYGIHVRPDVYYIDYRSPAQYMKDRYQPGDVVISVTPYALQYYAGIPTDYFLEAYPVRQMIYDTRQVSPQYLERTAGKPVIRNIHELELILNKKRRTWVVATPYTLFSFLSGREMSGYINEMGEVLYESYNARVYLLQS